MACGHVSCASYRPHPRATTTARVAGAPTGCAPPCRPLPARPLLARRPWRSASCPPPRPNPQRPRVAQEQLLGSTASGCRGGGCCGARRARREPFARVALQQHLAHCELVHAKVEHRGDEVAVVAEDEIALRAVHPSLAKAKRSSICNGGVGWQAGKKWGEGGRPQCAACSLISLGPKYPHSNMNFRSRKRGCPY